MKVSSFKFRVSSARQGAARRAFSLVEVLLAIFILGIGMIMVASVFPVGANWTRQTVESSVGQSVAQNAMTVIRKHYGVNGDLQRFLAPDFLTPGLTPNPFPGYQNSVLQAAPNATYPFMSPFTLQAVPGFTNISPLERAYQFGSSSPFPATNFNACTYFWTALIRLNPMHHGTNLNTNFIQPSASYNYDLFIFVFCKGAVEHHFINPTLPGGLTYLDILNTKSTSDNVFDESLIPSLVYTGLSKGSFDATRTPTIFNAVPPIGQYGVGAVSGTVFHQVLDPVAFQSAVPRPDIKRSDTNGTADIEPIIYSPPADGTNNTASPLIYVYQTTLTF